MSIAEAQNRLRALRRDRRYLVDRYEQLEEQLAKTELVASVAITRCNTLREEMKTLDDLLTKQAD